MTTTATAADRLADTPSDDGVFFEWKFERVRAPRNSLVRARLTDVLCESAPRLVLLAAPPGFGKTTLLAQWREVDGRTFACVSLNSGDNDPVTFWSYIVQAIRHAVPEWGAADVRAQREPRADAVDAVVPAVLRGLEAIGEKLVLVLDDYQEITNRMCHDSLSFFLERTPSNVTVAVSTRSDPPIPMGKLRAVEELLELRAVDLGFTEAESATFLNEIMHLGLATESLGALHERTEGWPVGVHLAAMSLSHEADPAGFVARFGGASRYIVDYLTEVVLDALDEDRHQFLLETSVLDTMSGPLCDAATGRQGSAEMLVELERANLFLIPLDDRREWYRYHELFADVLRNRLLQSDPELALAVHRRASEWLGPEGYRYEAVRHAVAAHALESAITLVLEDWRPSFEQDDAVCILRQLAELPPTNDERDARLAVVGAWALGALNRREESLASLELAESAGLAPPMPCGVPFEAATALTRACFPWGDSARMLGAAAQASELLSDAFSIARPVSLLALGWALRLRGEDAAACAPLEQAAFLAARSNQWLVAGMARAMLARISLETDDVDLAVVVARRALTTLEVHGVADKPGAGIAHVALGAALASRNELEEAGQFLDRGLANLRALGQPLDIADALLVSAPVRRALEAPAPARAMLDEARDLLATCPDPGVLSARLVEVARTLTPAHRRIEGDSDLTERELEVLRYLAEGLSKREIGKELFLSFNTIHSHTKSIYQKLRVSSRQDAIARAQELGAFPTAQTLH